MEPQRPLFWHQGLFLQPQHLQMADRNLQAMLAPYQRYLVPHFWGVCQMTIQNASLGARSFQISHGTFLFPDGTYVILPDTAVAEARLFDEGWIEGGKPFTVYLGLKSWNDAAENVTAVETLDSLALARVSTRFAAPADSEPCPDLHAGGPQAELKRLHFVMKILWENEIDLLGDYQLIPVAQLERTRDGIVVSRNFVPPCLTIGSSASLYATVQEIRDQLASRSRQLEGYKRQRGVQTAEFGSRDVVYLLALRTLNRYVPKLFHFIDAGEVHPWQIYGILRQLVGELSSFSETVTVLGESVVDERPLLPDYDHRNLGECFRLAHLLIMKLLDELTAGPEYVLPLIYDDPYYFSQMKPSHFNSRNRFFLVVKTEEDPKVVLQSMASLAKLSSRERLQLLIARALPGIGLEHLPTPPQELPRRAFCNYFAVDSRCEQWEFVQKGNNIALYWDNAPDDLEVELMVVERS
jgi:type VI secretion system protein ImpJ